MLAPSAEVAALLPAASDARVTSICDIKLDIMSLKLSERVITSEASIPERSSTPPLLLLLLLPCAAGASVAAGGCAGSVVVGAALSGAAANLMPLLITFPSPELWLVTSLLSSPLVTPLAPLIVVLEAAAGIRVATECPWNEPGVLFCMAGSLLGSFWCSYARLSEDRLPPGVPRASAEWRTTVAK
jgi:hypothetical protein